MKNVVLGFILALFLGNSAYGLEAGPLAVDQDARIGANATVKKDAEDTPKDQEAVVIATKVTKKQAIEIAKEYAVKEGRDLSHYPKIRATFDKEEGTWDVSFMMDPTPPGGYFDVIIDDKTGKVLHFWLGK